MAVQDQNGASTNGHAGETRPAIEGDKLVYYAKEPAPHVPNVNVFKPLMLIESLNIPHQVVAIPHPHETAWFHEINPQGLAPAMQGVETNNGQRLDVFESSSCLYYLVDKYDVEGRWGGKDLWEKTQVRNYVEMHQSGLGASAKYWFIYGNKARDSKNPKDLGADTLDLFKEEMKEQYTILNDRLSRPGQKFIALADRETIADFVNLPFANTSIAKFAGMDFSEWPRLQQWSEEMFQIDAVKRAWDRAHSFKATV